MAADRGFLREAVLTVLPPNVFMPPSDDLIRRERLADAILGVVLAELELGGTADEGCRRCGHSNPPWSAPSPLWNQVMRGGDINGVEIYDGIVCPNCFIELAEQAGIADLWRLSAERVKVPLQTITPSGRVWDEQAWIWQEP